MPRSQKRGSKTKAGPKGATRERSGSVLSVLLHVLPWAVLCAGTGGAVWVAEARASDAVRTGGVTVEIVPLRAVQEGGAATVWPPENWLEDLERRAKDAYSSSGVALGPAGLRAVSEVIAESGWAASAGRVVRDGGGVIRVEPDWHAPSCVVRVDGWDHLISRDGVRLPIWYRERTAGWRAIDGAPVSDPESGETRVQPGEFWEHESVVAGLEVIELLRTIDAFDQVRAVDVSRVGDDGMVEIVTDMDRRVVWGSAPGRERYGEASVERKLERLSYLRGSAQHGYRLDAGMDRLEVFGREVLVDERGAIRDDEGG